MYFSASTQGFYVGDVHDVDIMPKDCIEVNYEVEQFLRDAMFYGASSFDVKFDSATVDYPDDIKEWVLKQGAYLSFPPEQPA